MHRTEVAVVGGGIAGLGAARRLARLGHDVTLFDAGPRLGGQVLTTTVAGLAVDVGAEAVHAGAPGVAGLLAELGLSDEVVRPAAARTHLWTTRGLRPLPAGVGPAGPTRLAPVLRSRVLSPRGIARAAIEPIVPRGGPVGGRFGGRVRRPADGATDDVTDDAAVGDVVTRRFGRQVTERLVDPLLGGLHAGDVGRLSVRAVTPQLAAMVEGNRSLLLAHRARRRLPGGVELVTFAQGLVRLVDALATSERLQVRTSTPVRSVAGVGERYRLHLGDGTSVDCDAVVVALGADAAGRVLEPLLGSRAGALRSASAATVATVVVSYPAGAVAGSPAFGATGILVPSGSGRLLKSATFLGTKWPHLSHPEHFLVRLSAGRAGEATISALDDDLLVARLHADLVDATGLVAEPVEVRVQRWPRSMAQLEVGHLARMDELRAALSATPGVVLAGAAFDGVGIASCLRSGERAAAAIHDRARQGGGERRAPREPRATDRTGCTNEPRDTHQHWKDPT